MVKFESQRLFSIKPANSSFFFFLRQCHRNWIRKAGILNDVWIDGLVNNIISPDSKINSIASFSSQSCPIPFMDNYDERKPCMQTITFHMHTVILLPTIAFVCSLYFCDSLIISHLILLHELRIQNFSCTLSRKKHFKNEINVSYVLYK